MKPSVSLVMPIYQVEKYLKESLNSALKQSLSNIEIICVDDGSTDGCPAILDEVAKTDSRVKVIHNTNHGYGYSINTGFQAATGEYLAILEPDDLMPENALEVLYKTASANDIDVVKGNYCEWYQPVKGENKLVPARLYPDNSLYGKVFNAKTNPEVLVSQIINCTGIFKRQLVVSNDIRLSETPGASYQDVGLFFSLMTYAETIYFIDDVTYWYRNDNPASSTKNKGKLYMAENEYIRAQSLLMENGCSNEMLSASWCARWRGFLGTMLRIDSSLYEELLQYIRPLVLEADTKGLFKRRFCNAYQWEMLQKFKKDDKLFLQALAKANGKNGKLTRLLWRVKNDGLIKTISFLKQKREMQRSI